jgi:hypothetical protein
MHPKHPKKEVNAALDYADSLQFAVERTVAGHKWGRITGARAAGIRAAVDELRLGTELADALQVHLSGVGTAVLAGILTAGMTFVIKLI